MNAVDVIEADDYNVTLLAVALDITPLLARMVAAMLSKPACPPSELRKMNASVSVYIHRLRRKLSKFGVDIENRYGVGYVISPECRAVIRERVRLYEMDVAA